jgi:bacterial/archaeal transporter family-2 protein
MAPLWYLLALVIGACVVLQSPLNNLAARVVGFGPMLLVANALVLLVTLPIAWLWPETPRWSALAQVPLPHWGGALCGIIIVVGGLLVFPRLGPTTTLGLILIGQFALSALMEQLGWLGVVRAPMDLPKLLGIGLMLLGFLVTQYRQLVPTP